MRDMIMLIWLMFLIGGSVYMWHWEHCSGWIIVLGVALALCSEGRK